MQALDAIDNCCLGMNAAVYMNTSSSVPKKKNTLKKGTCAAIYSIDSLHLCLDIKY